MHQFIDSLNSISTTWSHFVWHISWQSALLAALIAAVIVTFRKKISAPVGYALLMVALLKFAIPPFLSLPTGVFSALPVSESSAMDQVPSELSPIDGSLVDAREFNFSPNSRRQIGLHASTLQFGEIGDSNQSLSPKATSDLRPNRQVSSSSVDEFERNVANQQKLGGSWMFFSRVSLTSWLMLLHLTGSLIVIIVLIKKTLFVIQLKKQATNVVDRRSNLIFDTVCAELDVRNRPKFLESRLVSAPVSFGCVDGVVLLPVGLVNSPELCSAAIAHEVAHLQRRDPWVNSLQNFLFVAWWFNPMLWVVNWLLRNLREDCCDDLILARELVTAESYSDTLIEIAKTSNNPMSGQISTAFGMADHPLANRLRRIMNPALERKTSLSLAGVFVVIVMAALMLPGLRTALATETIRGPGKSDADSKQEAHDGLEKDQDETLNADGLKKYAKFKIVDEEGAPIVGASVYCNTAGVDPANDNKPKVVNNTYETDQDGMVTIEFFDGCDSLRSWTSSEGRVTMFANWEDRTADDLPDLYTLVLQKATLLGGKVVDQQGNGIEGVAVEVSRREGGIKIDENANSRLGTWLSNGEDAAKTDKDGNWQIANVPPGDDVKLRFQLTHQKYISDERWQYMAHYKVTLEQLRNQSAVMTLKTGIEVKGTITDSNGAPVVDALVIWGDDPYYTQGSQEVRTDENGKYVTQALKPGDIRLTVVAKNWMPDSRTITVSESKQTAEDFKLKPGKTLHFKFVDGNGAPLPETYVSIRSWRGHKALYNMRHSNVKESKVPNYCKENGDYIWDWAPDDELEISVSNRKLGVSKQMTIKATDEPITIKLVAPFVFSGNVIEQESRKPINEYMITPITYHSESSAARGTAQSGSIKRFKSKNFVFDDAFSGGYAKRVAFRFDAIGYKSFTTEPYSPDTPSEPTEIALQATPVSSFQVIDENGQKVTGAFARVINPEDSFMVDRPTDYFSDNEAYSKPDENGIVRYATPTSNHAIVVANNDAYGEKYLGPGETIDKLVLQRWSKVEGVLVQDGNPVADASVVANPIRQLGETHPHVQDYFHTRTDQNGRFKFEKLPPVPTKIASRLGPWRDYPITSSKTVPVNLQPGKTHKINLGGEGLQIIGQVNLQGKGSEYIQFRYGLNNLVSTVPIIDIPEHARNRQQFQTGKQAEYDTKLWGPNRDVKKAESWFVKINPDGTFLINGVPPGEYRFLIKLYEPPKGCLVDPAAYKFIEFSTSEYDVVDNKLDLGQIDIQMEAAAREGDLLPQFSYTDLDGQRRMLLEHEGKYVLLDFWATWCGPCVKMIPDKARFYETISKSSELEFISLSVDDKLESVKEFKGQNSQMTWSQGFIGNVQKEQRAQPLGVSSVPLYLLIDPSGVIVCRTYDFNEIEKLVKETLEID